MDNEREVALRQLKESYRGIRDSIAYKDILNYLELIREDSLSQAESSLDVNYSYGLLKSAQACKTIKEYIHRMTS